MAKTSAQNLFVWFLFKRQSISYFGKVACSTFIIYFGELILTVDITNMLVNSSKEYHTSYEDFHNKNKMEKRPTLLGFFHWTVDGKFVNNFMMAYFFLLELTFSDQVKP